MDEDPVKLDLSTPSKIFKPALSDSDNSGVEDNCQKPTSHPSSPTRSTKNQDTIQEEPKGRSARRVEESAESAAESESRESVQVVKANLKRKIREDDEKENAPFLKSSLPAGTVTKNQVEKVMGEKANPTGRSINELPIYKRDTREKSTPATQRRPLGAKNSNEALGSPKKSAKAPNESKGTKPKAETRDNGAAKGQLKLQKEPDPIEIPPPSSPEAVTRVDIEPSPEPKVAVPDSHETFVSREEMNGTPPPCDISSRGETTRANRRARAAVSYAEPNLRDKMRRPNTKELFDAVAGEGKNIRRTSQCQRDELSSAPSSVAKSEAQFESSRKNASSQRTTNDAGQDVDGMASPLVQKSARTSALEELPASVTTDRRRKDPTMAQDHDADAAAAKPTTKGVNRRLEQIAAREAEVAEIFESSDVYEFTDSSPNGGSKEKTPEGADNMAKGSRQSRSRRLSSMAREDLQFNSADQSEKLPSKHVASRKRASMAAVRSAKSGFEDIRGESPSVDGDSSVSTVEGEGTTHEKVSSSRRRTTML